MTTKLNQILAIEKGVRTRVHRATTDAYHAYQRTPQLTGISRTYTPRDDDGEQLPPESTKVQVRAETALRNATDSYTRLFDVVATKDTTNTQAEACVILDGADLFGVALPVSTLLFLEKQLTDLQTMVSKLPVLEQSEQWHFDEAADCWATAPARTVKTKKIPRNHVLAAATDKHPAQVQTYTEDIPIGEWTTVKFSGAVPAARVRQLADRIETLREAVKFAREAANLTEVIDVKIGEALFDYLLAD